MTLLVPDATLDHWAGRFIDAGLAECLSFEAFMQLAPALRERRIQQMSLVRHVQHHAERGLPDAAVHGNRLIDPFHHGVRVYRHPGFYRRRNHA